MPAITDRERQDEIIRYLAAPNSYSSSASALLSDEDAERARRFSRFLTRRYYRDRILRGFRFSRRLCPGVVLESVVDAREIDAILESAVLGSFATGKQVSELVIGELRVQRDEPWWSDLLRYEQAYFLQLATSEMAPASEVPARSPSAMCVHFEYRMPELLNALRTQQAPIDHFPGPTTLLFSRTHNGRIYVVEVDAVAKRVFDSVDDQRDLDQISRSAGMPIANCASLLETLHQFGAVLLPVPRGTTI